MPWTVKRDPEGCSEQKPWAVLQLEDGEVVGCHATQDDAEAHVAALYANVDEDDPADYRDAMIAAWIDPRQAEQIVLPDGLHPGDLHVTLRYLGEADRYSALDRRTVFSAVAAAALALEPFDASVAGVGLLGEDRAAVLLLEHEGFNLLRESAQRALESVAGVPPESYPHYIPHLTLGYGLSADALAGLRGTTLRVTGLRVDFGDLGERYALGSGETESEQPPDGEERDMQTEEQPAAVEETPAPTQPVTLSAAPVTLTTSSSNTTSWTLAARAEEAPPDAPDRERAEARLSDVPGTHRRIGREARVDHRNLPPEVLERLESGEEDAGVIDRVGRGLCELRFRPEFRRNSDGTVFLHGYATVYGHPYEVMGGPPMGWVETIAHAACDVSVRQGADVRLLVNHEGIALARTRSGTLQLESDSVGLYCCAPNLDLRSPTVQSLVSAMERGDMDEMSFAFKALQQDWSPDYAERQITEVKLYDVSVVTYPANPATVTAVRAEEPEAEEVAEAPAPAGYPLHRAQAEALLLSRRRA